LAHEPLTMGEILYGRQPLRETLRAGRRRVQRLFLAAGVRRRGIVAQVLALAEQAGVPVQVVQRAEIERLSGGVHHQGLAAEVSGYPYLDLHDLLDRLQTAAEPPLFLLLDHVQDPQNLGSLLRTAEASGVQGVVLPRRRAAGVTPAAVRASAGAAEWVSVARVTNLVRAMDALKEAGVWLVGLEALPQAVPYSQADLSGPLGLVVGSEGQGLARLVRDSCDSLIRLPLRGRVGSLNAAVAGAIALYEALRQREAL